MKQRKFQYVYLIREREFVKSKKNIYKIGKTIQKSAQRVANYPKDSEGIIIEQVNDCSKAELQIKRVFQSEFKQRKDIGIEYYQGDIFSMKRIFRDITDQYPITEDSSDDSSDTTLSEHEDVDLQEAIELFIEGRFVLEHCKELKKRINLFLKKHEFEITGNFNDKTYFKTLEKGYFSSNRNNETMTEQVLGINYNWFDIVHIMIWNKAFEKGWLTSCDVSEHKTGLTYNGYFNPEEYFFGPFTDLEPNTTIRRVRGIKSIHEKSELPTLVEKEISPRFKEKVVCWKRKENVNDVSFFDEAVKTIGAQIISKRNYPLPSDKDKDIENLRKRSADVSFYKEPDYELWVWVYEIKDKTQKQIILKHLKFCGEMRMWHFIQLWLIQQVKVRKCISFQFERYHFTKTTGNYYERFFYHSYKDRITDVDVFLGLFRALLDKGLCNDYKKYPRPKTSKCSTIDDIYYSSHNKPEDIRFSDFNYHKWIISEGPELSPGDLDLLNKYKEGVIGFMERSIKEYTSFTCLHESFSKCEENYCIKAYVKECEDYLAKYKRITSL